MTGNNIELSHLLTLAQGYISKNYAASITVKDKQDELRAYISKYLYDTGYTVEGFKH